MMRHPGHSPTLLTTAIATIAAFVLVQFHPPARSQSPMPRDPEIARVLGALAHLDFESRRMRNAAERFDAAYARDPHPRWAMAAAEAWLAVPNPPRARERYLLAAVDPQLAPDVRTRLAARVREAETFVPLVERARKANDKKDHQQAMNAWLEVFEAMDLGRALLFAARAAEDAARWADAARILARCASRSDLSHEEQNEIAASLAAARAAIASEEAARNRPRTDNGDSLTSGILLGTSSLLLVAGVASLFAANAEYERIETALSSRVAGPVSVMTRREVLELERFANQWTAAGWTGIAAGAIGLGLGTWLVLREPSRPRPSVIPPRGPSVDIGVSPLHEGALIWARVTR